MKKLEPDQFDLPTENICAYGCEEQIKPDSEWILYKDLDEAIEEFLINETYFNSTKNEKIVYLGAFKIVPWENRRDENDVYRLVETVKVKVSLNLEIMKEEEKDEAEN